MIKPELPYSVINFFGCPIHSDTTEQQPRGESLSAQAAFEIIRPKPSPYPLIRIGGDNDGAYLVPDDLSGIKYCLSPGVNNFKDFEDELTTRYDIHCDMVDASSDAELLATPLIQGKQTFSKLWLDIDGSEQSISIAEWLRNKHGDCLLQIDIEGAEYRNLLATSKQDLGRFRIIVMELHEAPEAFDNREIFEKITSPILQKLNSLFACVHAHQNNRLESISSQSLGFDLPRLVELTFLRKDRILPAATSGRQVSLPHPLDITNEVGREPRYLDYHWMQGPQSVQSKLKKLQDWLHLYGCLYHRKQLAATLQARFKAAIKKRFTRFT
jgi:hypothetical protein